MRNCATSDTLHDDLEHDRRDRSFAQVLERTIELPKPLFPDLKYGIRGYDDREFVQIPKVIQHSWWDDTDSEQTVSKKESIEAVRPLPPLRQLRKFFISLLRAVVGRCLCGTNRPRSHPEGGSSDFT